jgi:hypothetical protein
MAALAVQRHARVRSIRLFVYVQEEGGQESLFVGDAAWHSHDRDQRQQLLGAGVLTDGLRG